MSNGTQPTVRPAAWLAWFLWAVSTGLVALGFVFLGLSRSARLPDDVDLLNSAVLGTFAVSFATVGLLIGVRRPENVIGWVFGAIGASWAAGVFATDYAGYVFGAGHGSEALGKVMLWLQN